MPTPLQQLLDTQPVVIADGGMGTMLIARGLQRGASPELWNVEHPESVRAIHAAYIEAGAQIILTNSFGGNRLRLHSFGLEARGGELNRAAAALARLEADSADHPVVVAGSIGPTGALLDPLGDLEYEDAVSVFAEQVAALVDGGVDLLWVETMSDLQEVRAALEACQQTASGFPRVATMSFDTHGRTMMGVTPAQAVNAICEWGVTALGANCGNGPDELEAVIAAMHGADSQAVLIAKANAGAPHLHGEITVYDAAPTDMADYARRVRGLGARIVGSCCGSTPEHIRAIADALRRS